MLYWLKVAMNPEQEQKIDKLVKAIDAAYSSPGRMFWRGMMWGLGRGVGNLIGFLVLLAILYYLFKLTGLDETFRTLFSSFQNVAETLRGLPKR